jgi:hypothetical protein
MPSSTLRFGRSRREILCIPLAVLFLARYCCWAQAALPLSAGRLGPDDFRYRSYAETNAELRLLALRHTEILSLTTSTAASEATCHETDGHAVPCETLIVELGSRPIAPDAPAVLILGPVYGDERVAASAAFSLVALFVRRAEKDPWISRLLHTRRILVVPLPSPAAYDQGVRVETLLNGKPPVDPAADFPFARSEVSESKDDACLVSNVARVVDELFSSMTFIVSLQLQEATTDKPESLSYSWGSLRPSLCGSSACENMADSPDSTAFADVASRMAAFAGPSHLDNEMLRYGALRHLSNATGGSLVDYAYASSFLPSLVSQCGGNAPTNMSHRAAAFIVEAVGRESQTKEVQLGRLDDMYIHSSRGNVVTRVLRAALVGIDMAAPYVFFMRGGDAGNSARGGIVHVRWSVGGSVTVDRTYLTCRLGDDGEEWTTTVKQGSSMWGSSFEDRSGLRFYLLNELTNAAYEFRTSLLLYPRLTATQREHGVRLHIRADAVVDQRWAPAESMNTSGLGPQTHLVQLRTNTSWTGKNLSNTGSIVSSIVWTIEVPALSGVLAILELAWEFVLLLTILSCGPPVACYIYSRRVSGGSRPGPKIGSSLRRKIRRSLHSLSKAEIAGEARLLRRSRPVKVEQL